MCSSGTNELVFVPALEEKKPESCQSCCTMYMYMKNQALPETFNFQLKRKTTQTAKPQNCSMLGEMFGLNERDIRHAVHINININININKT